MRKGNMEGNVIRVKINVSNNFVYDPHQRTRNANENVSKLCIIKNFSSEDITHLIYTCITHLIYTLNV